MVTLGDLLHEERMKRKLTLRAVSEKLDFTPMYISELETGKKIPDKSETLKKLADFYQLEYSDLLLRAKLSKEDKSLIQEVEEENLKVARKLVFEKVTPEQISEIKKILESVK